MIAIIEDDETIANLEQYALLSIGLRADIYTNGRQFFSELTGTSFQLVILDVMLPDLDGYAILKRLKSNPDWSDIPVIMVTAKGTEPDIVQGLDAGADDYISKPFGIREFLSRVRALLRRSERMEAGSQEEAPLLRYGAISMNDSAHEVFVGQTPVELTVKEYDLLKLLLQSPEKAISRSRIMNQVWGFDVVLESRTLDMHIRTLRQKLGDAGQNIQTIRKVGYKLTGGQN